MKEYDFLGCRVEVDEQATHDWYAQADEWGCDCGDCRNFLALARERKLPDAVLACLGKLGIPPEKATFVCELGPENGGHLYQVSWRVAGRILNEHAPDGSQPGSCGHETYPYGAPGFPEPNFDLEFFMTLPWVLDPSEDR